MARIKHISADSIDAVELAPSVTLDFENITIDVLMEFLNGDDKSFAPDAPQHDHSSYELIIAEDGSIDFSVENEAVTISAEDFIVIRPHVKHQILSRSPFARHFCLRFNIKSSSHHIRANPPKYVFDRLKPDEHAHILGIISELRKINPTSLSTPATYRMRAQFGIILSYILERMIDFDSSDSAKANSQISLHTKIENYLYLNYSKNITLDALSAYLSYSRTQTQRILMDCFGMPFTPKLREIRLSAAKELLADSRLSIDEIAEKCGYETRQGFEAMFLKHVGLTPNQYRKHDKK